MLQSTIPNWVETSSKIESNSEKGQKFDPAYEKIKTALKDRLEEEVETVSIGLDAWSNFHHGYLGKTIHFISKNWERMKFCLSCSKFDDRHTAANIYQKIQETAEDWDITSKIGVCLRDNAANVKAAFNEPGCVYESAGCLNHSLQLVIKKELFSMETVETLVEKCRKLCTHASHSNVFYTELYKQQESQMGNKDRLGLKNDVATRWNSTFYMLERILHLKPAIAGTLLKLPSSGIEFSWEDWNICEKVVTILGIFEEATKLLLGNESCISSCIPILTTIIQSLETTTGDDDMITENRFLNMERLSIIPLQPYLTQVFSNMDYEKMFEVGKRLSNADVKEIKFIYSDLIEASVLENVTNGCQMIRELGRFIEVGSKKKKGF
ncbi:zinc finger BED domain-containing protein 4-like [Hydra vulgaris]|uniref:Zinc finger BED domain-containing protein 4-like n=1 Tax=Hydra vulgaris TaxID=6087 RepID=A0ABM4DHE2_HYDVU